MPQDMPPTGGYGPIQYKVGSDCAPPLLGFENSPQAELILPQRNLPARGFGMGALIFGVSVVMTYGFYKLIQGARELQ